LTAEQLSRMSGLLRRRAEGEPAAYLIGQREFYGRDFRVTPATLIPRPETELLIETALKSCQGAVRFADLGTGSGCIAVTLCAERPEWRGIMADLSGRALAVACQNAARHKVRERLLPVRADFTRPLLRPASLDLLVSNPPYVGQREYEGLSAEVRDFEPVTALVPGFVDSDKIPGHHHHGPAPGPDTEPEGLEHLEAVAGEAFTALKPGGLLLMEHGWKQGSALKVLLESHTWENVVIYQDLAGRDRLVSARRPAS
ncbi:peptide chain release factor N(5)-glutamine methyltransferase, partial [uncultured Bilophila sp.]